MVAIFKHLGCLSIDSVSESQTDSQFLFHTNSLCLCVLVRRSPYPAGERILSDPRENCLDNKMFGNLKMYS